MGSASGWLMFEGMMARPHELGRDALGQVGAEAATAVLEQQAVARKVRTHLGDEFLQALVFPDGHVLHLGGHDAAPCVGDLGDGRAALGAQDLALAAREFAELARVAGGLALLLGVVAVVAGRTGPLGHHFDIASGADPSGAHARKAGLDRAGVGGIAPRTRRVVEEDWIVRPQAAIRLPRILESDLLHGHPDPFAAFAVDAADGFFGHVALSLCSGQGAMLARGLPTAA